MKCPRLLPLLLLSLPLGLAPAGEVRVEPDQGNVTSERLEGRWEWDPLVGERMGLEAREMTLEFEPDASFLDQVPDELAEGLSKLRFYESGQVTMTKGGRVSSSGPYLLTAISGNPHLIFFRARDGEPLGDAESANVIVVPGKERAHDLLLLGADFDNEPFKPFRRVEDGE